MRNVRALALIALLSPVPAVADEPVPAAAYQPVPAIHPDELPPPVPLLNTTPVPLGAKAVAGLGISESWTKAPNFPTPGAGGAVQFLYGSTLPTLVCAPLRVCDIRLQPGEVVKQINSGDAVEWMIAPAVSGDGADAVTHVLVKPVNSGLSTDIVISTNRRTYTILLVSDLHRWMPVISFAYPSDLQAAWSAYHSKIEKAQDDDVLPSGQNVGGLDFNFRISGDSPGWRPERVYTDGTKTYIGFPSRMLVTTAPVLLALGSSGGTEIVNYRVQGDVYVVDRVLTQAELISGVGSNRETVRIRYTGSKY